MQKTREFIENAKVSNDVLIKHFKNKTKLLVSDDACFDGETRDSIPNVFA